MAYLMYINHFIKKYKWTIILLLLLYIALRVIGCKKPIYVFAEFSIILLPLVIFSKLKIINFIIPILLSFIISAELSYFIVFAEPIAPVILNSILQTNIREAQVALPLLKFFIPLFIISCFLFIKVVMEVKLLSNRKLIIYSLVLLIIFSVSLFKLVYKFYIADPRIFRNAPKIEAVLFVKEAIQIKYPLLIGNTNYLIDNFIEKYFLNTTKSIYHEIVPEYIHFNEKKDNIPTKLIIVLGESSLPDNYSLYGYPFKTTPRLDQLYKDRQIAKFDQVITAIPSTNESIRLTFSYATPTNPKPFFTHKNIIEMANAANYQTLWVSSAKESGLYGNYAEMIASSSDIFLSPRSTPEPIKEEDLALPPIFQSLYQKGKKQFFIIHLQGSHEPYTNKYDKADEVLTTTPENTDYDRSIHHTDRLLAKLINIIKEQDENVILLYFSDHGEIINVGHGFTNGSIIQYKIPLITYQQKNSANLPLLVDKYRNKNGILNLTNMTYIMTELLGYDIDKILAKQARKDGGFVLRTDFTCYLFEQLQAILDKKEG